MCDLLEFSDSLGFVQHSSEELGNFQKMVFGEAKKKLDIDAIYFTKQNANAPFIPIIYFKKMKWVDQKSILKLHREV